MRTRMTWAVFSALGSFLALSGTAASSAAATLCVNPGGTLGCQSTIQAAVDLAGPGDTVDVRPGTYYENVGIPATKTGLRIVGASNLTTILDADTYTDKGISHSGYGIFVGARNVQIRNLAILNGRWDGVAVEEEGALLQRLRISGATGNGIQVRGPFAQLVQNEISNTTEGVVSIGFGTTLKDNTIRNCRYTAVTIFADGAQVIGNRILDSGFGIFAVGDGHVVRSNDVRHLFGGVQVEGRYPTIELNRIRGTEVGVIANCTDCFGGSVARNVVTDSRSNGMILISDLPGLQVQRNLLVRTGFGVSLNGTGILAERNHVKDAGSQLFQSCFEVFGSSNRLTGNTAANCSKAGFFANGSRITLDNNVATGTFENGFTIDGSNGVDPPFADAILTGNRAFSAAGQGFAVIQGAVNTSLTGNVAARNRTDFCDEGTGTSSVGNTFGTTSATCAIAH